ncbi:hypothetical protein JCM16358_16810 [Halanaerocella petrolearia]
MANQKINQYNLADTVEKVTPSIVKIKAINSQDKVETGAGIIINSNGYLITSKHLINKADQIKIKLKDQSKYKVAKAIGNDTKLDIALLKINEKELPTASLGDSNRLRPGDLILAIGHPYGFDYSISLGIISATNRSLKLEEDGKTETYNNLIQTDAAINPGNSGGPILNTNGEVVGINIAINFKAHGISFAIPINQVKDSIRELKKHGKIIRPWLGIYLQNLNDNLKQYFDLNENYGVLISNITTNSPAAKSKLRTGDIILKFNNHKIKQPIDLKKELVKLNIGQQVTITILRNDKYKTFTLQIAEKPAQEKEIISE